MFKDDLKSKIEQPDQRANLDNNFKNLILLSQSDQELDFVYQRVKSLYNQTNFIIGVLNSEKLFILLILKWSAIQIKNGQRNSKSFNISEQNGQSHWTS